MYYLQPRSQEDLRRRNRAHRKIADFCFGLMGRTPDAFAGNLTGLSMKPEVFDSEPGGSRANLLAIYQHVRRNDLFATYAIVPPQGARNKDYYLSKGLPQPALRVTAEDDKGVTLNGMKMLASGAAYAHEVLIGNVMPLARRSAQGIHHLRDSVQSAGPNALVARAIQPAGHELLRSSAHHALR